MLSSTKVVVTKSALGHRDDSHLDQQLGEGGRTFGGWSPSAHHT